MERSIRVSHFSDVLCIWAYVAEVRMDELHSSYGEQVAVERHFCQVFGDTESKLVRGWAERGGMEGYGDHVRSIAAEFEHIHVHPDVWSKVRPRSSLPCHLFLLGVRLVCERAGADDELFRRTTWAFRDAFFQHARDISDARVRHEVAETTGVPTAEVENLIADGSAHAALTADLTLAREFDVRVSPTLVFNQGRQRLNGNVGYRIIEANVRELLARPQAAHSWC